jgi:hypothetical protein
MPISSPKLASPIKLGLALSRALRDACAHHDMCHRKTADTPVARVQIADVENQRNAARSEQERVRQTPSADWHSCVCDMLRLTDFV